MCRQLAAPAVGSERVFVLVVGNVASGAAEPTWVITRGGKTTDATETWQECTGIAAINGDFSANTPTWTTVKNTVVTLGQVINNVARTIVLICTTAGTAGNGAEPSWASYTTAGATTADNTATWTNIGVVGNFTGWQAPHARLMSAGTATWAQAGNKVYVRSNHAETQTTLMLPAFPSSLAAPLEIYCVAVADTSLPPTTLATTATVTCSASDIRFRSTAFYVYGISFLSGSGSSSGSIMFQDSSGGWSHIFENCALILNNTNAGSLFSLGNSGANAADRLRLINTPMTFGAAGQIVRAWDVTLEWRNTANAIAGTAPTTLFAGSGFLIGSNFLLNGVDLSLMGSGKTIFSSPSSVCSAVLVDCKLGASVTVSGAPSGPGCSLNLIRCDSGATNYRDERYWYEGTQTVETTIVRTGGATDGATPIAWKLVTTANSKWVSPFESQPIAIWNDLTSAITTLTIYGTTTGGGVPNNDDIWVEVEYLGSSSTPQGSFVTTTKANNLAASVTTNNSSDASTWGGGGAGNGFKIVVPSFTPGMKGPLNITIKVAKASATYYIDPKPVIT